jgi:hypothetical protein
MTVTNPLDWPEELAAQLAWHWSAILAPRLAGLSDEEYFWEPAPGCWSVRPRGQGVAVEVGGGPFVIHFALPEPDPPPLTTIAWRFGHLLVGVFGARNATYFGGPPVDYATYSYPGTADAAVAGLTDQVERWLAGVRGLGPEELAQRCEEAGHESESMAALVLHIQREAFHHGAEIALLRDLFRATGGGPPAHPARP